MRGKMKLNVAAPQTTSKKTPMRLKRYSAVIVFDTSFHNHECRAL